MSNYHRHCGQSGFSYGNLIKRLIFTTACVAVILFPASPSYSQQDRAAEIFQQASQNIQKYRMGTATISFSTGAGKPVDGATVVIEQTSQDFLFGNIIFPLIGVLGKHDRQIYEPELFKRRFKGLFNFAIFPFYWSAYEEIPGREEWNKIVPVVEWCNANGITAKGHPLAWVERGGTPRWLYEMPVPLTEELLKARIIRIVRGFKGQIDIWDVVNEPTHTISWSAVMKAPFGTRYTSRPINEIADWVDKCYRWAREANPEATLIINDYEQIVSEFIPDTRERFYKLVAELKKRGTPIDGIGLQAHAKEYWYSPEQFWDTLEYYSTLELPIHITEFIPQSSGNEIKGEWKKGKWTREAQAEFAEQIYRLSFGHPSVASINWWGLSDRYIWSERPGGGLIDENYRPKPVYQRLRHLIKEQWMTRTTATTGHDGSVDFRGFYGNYKVTLKTKQGDVYSFDIHLRKNEENNWRFRLSKN